MTNSGRRISAEEMIYIMCRSLSGLTLEIDIEQDQYISQLSQESGVRVSIGGQEEMPFPYEQGISASPGYSTAIQLRKVRY